MDFKAFFEQYLHEDGEDNAPDADMGSSTGPPDIPEDASPDDGPPDMGGDDFGDSAGDDIEGGENDSPPDMDMGDDFGSIDDGMGDGEEGDDGSSNGENNGNNLEIDDKISAIMNKGLYQRFLSLLSTINDQISSIKKNNDILYSLSNESIDIVASLTKLDENIRLYIDNKFLNENYSINLLFFNKCLKLLSLLNDNFDKQIRKSIKNAK